MVAEIKQAIGHLPGNPPSELLGAKELVDKPFRSELLDTSNSKQASEPLVTASSEQPPQGVSEPIGEPLVTASSEQPPQGISEPIGEPLVTAPSEQPPQGVSEPPGEPLVTAPSEQPPQGVSEPPGEPLVTAPSEQPHPAISELSSELPNTTLTADVTGLERGGSARETEFGMDETSDKAFEPIPLTLTGAALARRLGVATASISRNKTKDNFAQWTSLHDPDGISWYFDGQIFHRLPSSPPPEVQ